MTLKKLIVLWILVIVVGAFLTTALGQITGIDLEGNFTGARQLHICAYVLWGIFQGIIVYKFYSRE